AVSTTSRRSTTPGAGTRPSDRSPRRPSRRGTLSPPRPDRQTAATRCPRRRVNSTHPCSLPWGVQMSDLDDKLLRAAETGDLAAVTDALHQGAEVNARGPNWDRTAL